MTPLAHGPWRAWQETTEAAEQMAAGAEEAVKVACGTDMPVAMRMAASTYPPPPGARYPQMKKVANIVESHPEESISILRSWLHEG